MLFGLYHGLWVVLYGILIRRIPESWRSIPGGQFFAIAFHLVFVGLVGSLFFRERQLGRILQHLWMNPFWAHPDEWAAVVVLLSITVTCCIPLLLQWIWVKEVQPRLSGSPYHLPLQTTGWALMAFAMFLFYRTTLQDFVYFQF